MYLGKLALMLGSVGICLAGCTGKYISDDDLLQVTNGTTKKNQVRQILGEPYRMYAWNNPIFDMKHPFDVFKWELKWLKLYSKETNNKNPDTYKKLTFVFYDENDTVKMTGQVSCTSAIECDGHALSYANILIGEHLKLLKPGVSTYSDVIRNLGKPALDIKQEKYLNVTHKYLIYAIGLDSLDEEMKKDHDPAYRVFAFVFDKNNFLISTKEVDCSTNNACKNNIRSITNQYDNQDRQEIEKINRYEAKRYQEQIELERKRQYEEYTQKQRQLEIQKQEEQKRAQERAAEIKKIQSDQKKRQQRVLD